MINLARSLFHWNRAPSDDSRWSWGDIRKRFSPRVSIITPTRDREEYIMRLHGYVSRQLWPNLEWLILDDSQQPSVKMQSLRDKRIRYFHDKSPRSVGEKRNELIRRATGDFIAHFDDDDFYSPSYITEALDALQSSGASIRKLTGMYLFDRRYKRLFFWDQSERAELQFVCKYDLPLGVRAVSPQVVAMADAHRLGYGFSYVYRRVLSEHIPFPDVNFGEDLCFMKELLHAGHKAIFDVDLNGTCVHVIHDTNLSGCFPQFMIPRFLWPRSVHDFDLVVGEY